MREAETTIIGNYKYKVTALPAMQGARVLRKLGQAAGPAIAMLAAKEGTEGGGLAAIGGAIGEAVSALTKNLNDDDLESIFMTLAGSTQVEAEPGSGKMVVLKGVFDMHFQGDFMNLGKWVAFALKVNFGPLLDALPMVEKAGADGSAARSASTSPKESTG